MPRPQCDLDCGHGSRFLHLLASMPVFVISMLVLAIVDQLAGRAREGLPRQALARRGGAFPAFTTIPFAVGPGSCLGYSSAIQVQRRKVAATWQKAFVGSVAAAETAQTKSPLLLSRVIPVSEQPAAL
jgi:hypothetical protein